MTYQEAIQYMETIGQRGSVLGLEPVRSLLNRLDNPQEQLDIIHVAGTNGKGSICTFLEAMYRGEGKRVGRYISPTIHTYLERFQMNGHYMEEEIFASLLTRVDVEIGAMREEGCDLPTAFEIETAIAFLYFVQEHADIVILEVGMGGREDATNVISHPLCSVFANIGMDHMQFLGDTLEKIAYEKAGIIKKGCPVVCYPGDERTIEVLRREFEQVNSSHSSTLRASASDSLRLHCCFAVADTSSLEILSEDLDGSTFIYKGEEYAIPLAGTYQIYNAITAIDTKRLLDGHLVKEALGRARWEGRFEKISDKPLFIRDGAHNVQGVTALRESLQKHFTNARFIFIIGVLKDKEYEKMMELLCPMADACYLVRPRNARGLDTTLLGEVVSRYCEKVTRCESVEEAVALATAGWRESEERLFLKKANRRAYEERGCMTRDGVASPEHVNSGVDIEEECVKETVIVAWGSLSYIGEITM